MKLLLTSRDECFSESELPQHTVDTAKSPICHTQKLTSTDVCMDLMPYQHTRVAWLTTIAIHYTVNALSAGKLLLCFPLSDVLLLLTLSCSRQLLLNAVYLHLSAISLDCFFDFIYFCLFPIKRVSVKVFSPLPCFCLDFRLGNCLSHYLCCALVLICIPSQYISIQR